jgi:inhibitor of KinA
MITYWKNRAALEMVCMDNVRLLTAGEQGLVLEFGDRIEAAVNERVHQTAGRLTAGGIEGIIEVVPTYRSLLVYFDPLAITREVLSSRIMELMAEGKGGDAKKLNARVVEIPVCYGGELGPDLDFVASHNKLTHEEVIAIHTSAPYMVYMLGFMPGFPYLGGMSERIATPRLEKPRTAIPAGSVGIAGSQTGFYPVESPGGWQIIGRTPIKAFNPDSQTPFPFAAGDYLKFRAITREEFAVIQIEVATGEYRPIIGKIAGKDGVGN